MTTSPAQKPAKPKPAKKPQAKPQARPPDLQAQLQKLESTVKGLDDRIKVIERRYGKVELSGAVQANPLTFKQISTRLASDPRGKFCVLEDFKHGSVKLARGREMYAQHYDNLADLVRAGLMLTEIDD